MNKRQGRFFQRSNPTFNNENDMDGINSTRDTVKFAEDKTVEVEISSRCWAGIKHVNGS